MCNCRKNRTIMGWCAVLATLALGVELRGHDTWVQTNTNIVRVGDSIHVDLMLGNHGNDHRDFKIAGKTTLEGTTLEVISPEGSKTDLKPKLADLGYDAKEGYWWARYSPAKPGLHIVSHTSDRVVAYAPTRSIKSGKTFFVASKSLDSVPVTNPGFDRVLGHELELVPRLNPVTPMGPGAPMKVQLLYKGKPLADTRVSFIPRGQKLSETFDEKYERKTDKDGLASFEPTEGNVFLI